MSDTLTPSERAIAMNKLPELLARIPMSVGANVVAYSLAWAEEIGWPVIRSVMLEVNTQRQAAAMVVRDGERLLIGHDPGHP